MRFKFYNFQSIKEAEVLIEGFTAITGPSNLGKSAFVRAFLALITNRKGNNFVRKGADNTDLQVESGENSVRWVKGSDTEYWINGQHNPKAGRSTPKEEIANALGVYPIITHKSAYYPQIQKQFEKPFIVSESSPTTAAELLSASKHNQILTTAIKLAQVDHRKKETEIEVRQGIVFALKTKLDILEPLFIKLKENQDKTNVSYAIWSVGKAKLDTLIQLQKAYVLAQLKTKAVNLAPENLPRQVVAEAKAPRLQLLWNRYEKASNILQLLKSVTSAPVVQIDQNRTLKMERLYRRYESARKLVICLKGMKSTPEIQPVQRNRDRWSEMNFLRERYREKQKTVNQVNQELEIVVKAFNQVEESIQGLLKDLGICPVCKQQIK